jgi:ABC-type nitrate/sulfonate/bicarbonate transport system ATPase subunit
MTTHALDRIDLTVREGEFVAIVGPSGCGKSTLLRIVAGILKHTSGSVRLASEEVTGAQTKLGIVFQSPVLLEWRNILDNVLLQLELRDIDPKPYLPRAHELLAKVGLGEFHDRRPRELSGGQRQRTLIARALAANPELLALDEPTNGMDPAAELEALDVLRGLHRAGGLCVVMVSHRLEAVANYAEQLAFVDKDQALFRVGKLDEMLAPEALGALYGRNVKVRQEDGRWFVYPNGGTA